MNPGDITKEEVSRITEDYLFGTFHKTLMSPWIRETKERLLTQCDKELINGAKSSKFAMLSGKRQMLRDLEEQFEAWHNTKNFIRKKPEQNP